MLLKNVFLLVFVTIALTDVECGNGPLELYSKLIAHHNYLVPPSIDNISVSVNFELSNLVQLDSRNQEMTFSGIINLYWNDSSLSWNQSEYSFINSITLQPDKVWTPSIQLWNAVSSSHNIQSSGGNLFISANGKVHWPIFGLFKTACTIDVTYYPFDQQTCVVKVGSTDRSIQVNLQRNTIDLDQFYMNVYWDVIETPAYQNVYKALDNAFPAETDVTYYLVIRRRTHWLSEVYPVLALAFVTIIPAFVTRSLEKLILQVFCIAALFALHMDVMNRLPPTSLVVPSIAVYIVSLIVYNLIHLMFTSLMNNRRECLQWIAQRIQFQQLKQRISRNNEEERKKSVADDDVDENFLNGSGNGQPSGDKIATRINWIIFVLLVLAVSVSTINFIRDRYH